MQRRLCCFITLRVDAQLTAGLLLLIPSLSGLRASLELRYQHNPG